MYPSPCDGTCCLESDVNNVDRCISCLRMTNELNWDKLPKERQEEVLNRNADEYFTSHTDMIKTEEKTE